MPHGPGQKIGAYEVVSALGAGGMGEVYRARDTKLKRDVAIKVLPADVADNRERLARFQREAEVLASLNHPHIAQIYGFENPPEGGHHLVMELVDGEDLSLRIARGAIPIDEALQIAQQIAEALETAHEAGIVHRDLKPGNIKVKDDGTIKVLDFGLAKALETGAGNREPRALADSPTIASPAMTMRGVILGTAAYMSPEQAKGKVVDRRADIWAFGCVFYEMLSGARAFKGEDVTDIITSVMRDTPDWNALPSATPAGVRTLLRRCIEKDPHKRAPHMSIARLAIDDAMAATGELVAAATNQSVRSLRSRAWTIAPWMLAGALAIALVAIGLPRSPEPSAATGDIVRFPLPVPDEFLRITTRPSSMSLSNDGTRLAFMASSSTNRLGLFVREMSSIEPRVMPVQIANMAWPAWSPDGRYLAVTLLPIGRLAEADTSQGGVIRRIDPSGGPAATIAEWGRYAIWGSAGVIVYSGQDGRAYRVSEHGGTSSAITAVDGASGEVAHLPMSFFPDGRRFIYTVLNRDTEKTATFVGSIDDGARTPLTVPSWRVALAGEWLWYLRDGGTLTAQRIDPSTFRFEGGPVAIAENVANFAVSAAGTLVTVPRDSVQVKMAWLDPHGGPAAPVGDPGGYAGLIRPDLSPDGTRMVYMRVEAGSARPDIWQIDLARNVATRVVATPFIEDAAVYSPDGKYIVFSSNPSGVADLYRRAADGSGADELLYASSLRKTPTAISPDGSVLLFTQAGVNSGADIWVLPLHGDRVAKPLVATSALEGNAQFSPDGRWFAYCAQEAGERDQVIVEPYPPTGARTRISTTEGNSPRWSASGREIYYGTPSGQIMRVSVATAAGSIRAGPPQNVVIAPQLFTHSAFVLDAQSRILALDPGADERREPATVILNWPALLKGRSPQ